MRDIFLLHCLRESFALNSPEAARKFGSMTSVQVGERKEWKEEKRKRGREEKKKRREGRREEGEPETIVLLYHLQCNKGYYDE